MTCRAIRQCLQFVFMGKAKPLVHGLSRDIKLQIEDLVPGAYVLDGILVAIQTPVHLQGVCAPH